MMGMGAFVAVEERLAAWETRPESATRDELTQMNWGSDPRRIAHASLWWLIGIAWIAVDAWRSDVPDRVPFIVALVLFALAYVGVVLLPRRYGTRVLALGLTIAVCVAGPLLTRWVPGASYVCVVSAMAAVFGMPLGRPARAALLAVVALTAVCTLPQGGSATFDATTSALLGGIVSYNLHVFVALMGFLRAARDEQARAAVATERLRFARDLHDLLGHSLSVIVVQAEVVRRLVERDPEAAAQAAGEIETVGRAALTQVRQAVTGYREQTLADEIALARQALRAAGITLLADVDAAGLTPRAESVLAWAVREGSTNVIRHSDATTCRIVVTTRAGSTRLTMTDDGGRSPVPVNVEARASSEPASLVLGNGLRGLAERLQAVGGRLRVERAGAGVELTASLPTPTGTEEES